MRDSPTPIPRPQILRRLRSRNLIEVSPMSVYTETILPPGKAKGLSRWVVALIIVVAIHLAVGVWIVTRHSFARPAGQPTNAVFIDLAPIETAPPQVAAPKPEAAPPKVEPPPPPPEPPMQSVPEAPAVMAAPPPVTPPVPKILQTEEAPVILPPPPPPKPMPDKAQEQKKIEQQKHLEQKRVEQERRRKERAELRKKRAEKQRELRKERAERARAAAASRASRPAAPRAGNRGRSIAEWQRGVQARVSAAAHSVSSGSGSATLTFTVEANGRIVSPHIVRSSGSAAVDRAVLSIPRRIGRLPPPPNGRISVRVPVRFSGF